MPTQQFVPVTEAQASETKISNSVKISKQLMKAELKKRHTKLKEEYGAENTAANGYHSLFIEYVREDRNRQIKLSVDTDSELTRFRNLYAKFSSMTDTDDKDVVWKKNSDLVQFDEIDDDISYFINYEALDVKHSSITDEELENWKKHRILDATVKLVIPDLNNEGNYGMYGQFLSFDMGFQVCDEHMELLHRYVKHSNKATELNNQYNAVEAQLKDIDNVAEQMEATLLVQELAGSEEGKKALAVASQLVGDMLGDTPTLLGQFADKG